MRQQNVQGAIREQAMQARKSKFDSSPFAVYLSTKEPTPVTAKERKSEGVMFAHVGKAGGSSILKAVLPNSKALCRQGRNNNNDKISDASSNTTTRGTLHACTVASRVRSHVHMNLRQNTYKNFKHFLMPIRNPVDRIISWYNYEIRLTQTERHFKNIIFKMLWQHCYPTINELVSIGLQEDTLENIYNRPVFSHCDEYVRSTLKNMERTNINDKKIGTVLNGNDDDRNSSSALNGTEIHNYVGNDKIISLGFGKNGHSGKQMSCQQAATDCIVGRLPCHTHNFYNFEVYGEDLVLWKEVCFAHRDVMTSTTTNKTVSTGTKMTTKTSTRSYNKMTVEDDDDEKTATLRLATQKLKTLYGPPHHELDCVGRRKVRIDVIRLEHVYGDFNRTMELWTGTPLTSMKDIGYEAKNTAKSLSSNRTTEMVQTSITKLCKQLCPELIIYKKLLLYADNLYGYEVIESWKELDERCNMDVDDMCGTDFIYRSIKMKKGIIESFPR